jgi:plasmid stabilization system protein ParE
VTRLVVTETAARSLTELIDSHSLPIDTQARVRRTLEPLERFPLFGPALDPASPGLRFLIGPWRWLVIVYAYREAEDIVAIFACEDGRSARSATATRESRRDR